MRRIVLELAENTGPTKCGDCPLACCESHCEAFGELADDCVRHPDCIAAERAASRLLDVSPEDAEALVDWCDDQTIGYPIKRARAGETVEMLRDHAKKAEVKP